MSARTRRSPARQELTAADRVGLWLVAAGAAVVALLAIVSTVLRARATLGSGPIEVAGMPTGPGSSPELSGAPAGIIDARYESLALTVDGAPASVRWLLWSADAVSSLAVVGICLTLVWLCLRVRRQRPFGRSVTASLLVTAILVMIGGSAGQVLAAIGRAELAMHLQAEAVADILGRTIVGGFAMTLDLAPIGIGLALSVVAVAFQIGTRLQRDTEGLV